MANTSQINPLIQSFDYTTGSAHLRDTGLLSYNGCVFSPLFYTSASGQMVKDNAQRTVKLVEYTFTADGYVTPPNGVVDINPVMRTLRELLSAQGGTLIYRGRGMDLAVNDGPGGLRDVAWGPVPEILDFQPLGRGNTAKIRWQVKVRIPEVLRDTTKRPSMSGLASIPLLQFNYDTTVGYGEDGYSSLSIKGTAEIGMTRNPLQTTRTLTRTVDDVRSILDDRIFPYIDLSRFRITRREFSHSRDKRTMEWNVTAEEKPYMDLPADCTVARGTFSVRPAKAGAGLASWLCTLRATYTVRGDRPRRVAWESFLALLRLRMSEDTHAQTQRRQNNQNQPPNLFSRALLFLGVTAGIAGENALTALSITQGQNRALNARLARQLNEGRSLLIDFSFDEGLYLDSKTVTFSATWRLVTTFSHIMLASGLWKKLPENNRVNELNRPANYWAASMRDVSRSRSWLPNTLDPNADIIVDFGSD